MSRVTKTAEKRRQEIMSTARRLFLQRGYSNTSVANIANELGVAQGLIFHYFKSKSALLYAVFDEVSQEKQQQVEAFLQDCPAGCGRSTAWSCSSTGAPSTRNSTC